MTKNIHLGVIVSLLSVFSTDIALASEEGGISRVTSEDEETGVDISSHGESSYN